MKMECRYFENVGRVKVINCKKQSEEFFLALKCQFR